MLRTIYGFDDLGRKVPTGNYDDGARTVGGRIFYIDQTCDETVEFYDTNGNVISNVAVGDTPSYYKVTSAGVSGKEKYYIFNGESFDNFRWLYEANIDPGYVGTQNNSDIGKGKLNTQLIMDVNNGIYINGDVDGYPTMWYKISQMRSQEINGCNDWYIPSIDELEQLRLYIINNTSVSGIIDFFTNNKVWSSTEASNANSAYARLWENTQLDVSYKYNARTCAPIRSF